MTKRDVLAVAVKILGLTLFVQAIMQLPGLVQWHLMPQMPKDASGAIMFWLSAGHSLLFSIGGVILMACASGIAGSMVREDSILSWPQWICNKAVLFDFGTRVYGIVLLAHSIPLLVAGIVERMQSSELNTQIPHSAGQSIVASTLSFVIGVLLVIGIGRIGSYIKDMIGAGKKTLEGPNA